MLREILHPKEKLVSLASKSKDRSLREDLVPARGSTAKVGPGYNARLSDFVRRQWNPARAAEVSPSLDRALRALRAFRTRIHRPTASSRR